MLIVVSYCGDKNFFPESFCIFVSHKTFGNKSLPSCHREVLHQDQWYLVWKKLPTEQILWQRNWKKHLQQLKGSSSKFSRDTELVKTNFSPLLLMKMGNYKKGSVFVTLKKYVLGYKIVDIYFFKKYTTLSFIWNITSWTDVFFMVSSLSVHTSRVVYSLLGCKATQSTRLQSKHLLTTAH